MGTFDLDPENKKKWNQFWYFSVKHGKGRTDVEKSLELITM